MSLYEFFTFNFSAALLLRKLFSIQYSSTVLKTFKKQTSSKLILDEFKTEMRLCL